MQNLFELTEFADESLKSDKQIDNDVLFKLRDIVQGKQFIGIAQINTISGALEYNAKKIAKYIKFATDIGLECVVFPELSLMGYPFEDTVGRYPFLAQECYKWLEGLAKLTVNTIALIGFAEPASDGMYKNSVAVIQNGKIQGFVRKSSSMSKYGSRDVLCQTSCDEYFDNNDYVISVGGDYLVDNNLKYNNAKLFINCSALPFNYNMDILKRDLQSSVSKKIGLPSVFVNQVGANDCTIFDGISSVFNYKGELVARAKAYEEQFMIVDPYNNIGKIYPLPKGFELSLSDIKSFSLDYDYDLERVYKALVLGVKDYFKKCGLKRAVLGLSGGLDSSVCAVILADALGKENVYGISMPSHITSSESKSDAEQLANNLGIHFAEAPIRDMIDTTTDSFNKLFEKVEISWNDRYTKSFTPDNIQARSRAAFLWGVSNEFPSCIPIATSDKSEAYMGYATINGDMSGGFAPIADITKTKLFALARWLNRHRLEKNVIPESVINKRPGAELAIDPKTGKALKAEDALMPYEFLDEIIWRIENSHETYQDMLNSQFIYEKQNSISKEQKIEWLDKFFNRMSKALYKWSIMPPYVMVEPHSINHIDYTQPITSCRINYKGVSEDYINESLTLN